MTVPIRFMSDPIHQPTGQTWLDARHVDWSRNFHRWCTARDAYTAMLLDPSRITRYLIRKATAESETAFLERTALADYTPHFATIVDTLAGMLFAVEEDAKRDVGDNPLDDKIQSKRKGIGPITDDKSALARMWTNIDGNDTGWITFFKQLAIELLITHKTWIITDQDASGRAKVRLWHAENVVNWRYDPFTGQLAEVLVTEEVDTRVSVKDDVKKMCTQQWVLYTQLGWERWQKDTKGQPRLINAAAWGVPFKDREGNQILPIFPVELPLRRQVGYILSKKAISIFNKESERDSLLRSCGFPFLIIVGADEQYEKTLEEISRGIRALRQDPTFSSSHQFIAPDSGPATVQSSALREKITDFYINGFREYGDAAREKSATEVKQDVAAGVGALLQMLRAAVDDAENATMLRVAQIEYPTDSDRWYSNSVSRSENFVPTDVQMVIERMVKRYFPAGTPVALGPTALKNVARTIAEYDGIQFEELELQAAINIAEMKNLRDLMRDFPFPAEVRVGLTLDMLVQLGKVDPAAKVQLEGQTEQLVIDQLKKEMMKLAMADDEARLRMATAPLDQGPPV